MTGNTSSPVLLITTLAEYQTEFWLAVGLELRRAGHEVAYISFDDRSTEALVAAGFQTFATAAGERHPAAADASFDAALLKYGMDNINAWFTHERITFGIRDTQVLRTKFLSCLALAERACTTLVDSGRPITMVQELGGFLSVIASFFAARRHGIDNWFIEPAFFRGRMLFLRNSFLAHRIGDRPARDVSPAVREYLQKTLENRAIVVPKKDKHQYTTAFRKIVNMRNAKRLAVKLVDKYVHGKRQEFGHIGRHVKTHLLMLTNSLRLRGSYTPLNSVGRFVYYPLHVPADMALTLRSPEYLDQLALIAYIARSVPHTHKVVIKEHPAMIGAVNATRLKELLACYDNIVLLPPSTNNYDVLHATDAVVSVNSKSGAEAALLGKPVLVLGDAFYRDSPLVKAVDSLAQLPQALRHALSQPQPRPSMEAIERYFDVVWEESLPGELYIAQSENVRTFADSLLSAISTRESTAVAPQRQAG